MPTASQPRDRSSTANCSFRSKEREAVMTVAPASASASETLHPNKGPAPAVTRAMRPLSEKRSRMDMITTFFHLSFITIAARPSR
jgi:hypothetical protein